MAHFWFNKLGGINLLLHCDYNEEMFKIVNEKKYQYFTEKYYTLGFLLGHMYMGKVAV